MQSPVSTDKSGGVARVALLLLVILIGKLSGFLKDVFLTYVHGISVVTDAFFLASSVSTLIYMAVFLAVPVVVVPWYARVRHKGDRTRSDIEMTRLLFVFGFLSLVLAFGVMVLGSPIMDSLAKSASADVRKLASGLVAIMALTFFLSTAVAFFNSLQTVNGLTMPSYSVPLVNNLAFCVGLAAFSEPQNFANVLYVGVGAWVLLLLVNYMLSRKWFLISLRGFNNRSAFRSMAVILFPALVSFYVEQLNGFVGVFYAAKLGAGSISVLSYANKLNLVFLSVFLVLLTASIFPRIANISVGRDRRKLASYLVTCTSYSLILALPFVFFVSYFAEPVVSLLFERGSFTSENARSVASILAVVAAAIPFLLLRDIVNRVFFSFGDTLTPVLVTVASLAMHVVISSQVYSSFGLRGIAISATVSSAVGSIVILSVLHARKGVPIMGQLAGRFSRIAIAGGAAIFVVSSFERYLSNYWIALAIPFAIVYLAGLYLLRVREVLEFREFLLNWSR